MRLRPLLPPQRPRTGRPARDHRTILSAILGVLRTGAPWRDLPKRFGPWATAWSRFRRWTAAGVSTRVLEALQLDRMADRDRDRVERLVNKLKQHRRVATRYEKRAGHYLALLLLAAILLWL
jgi:transposase